MKWEVEYTDEFGNWWCSLDEAAQDAIDRIVHLLEEKGPSLDYPYSSDIAGSRHGNMRELRIQHKGRPFRAFYAFDPRRSAIVLIGGDKSGLSDKRFYGEFIPQADSLYDQYLIELQNEGLIEDGTS